MVPFLGAGNDGLDIRNIDGLGVFEFSPQMLLRYGLVDDFFWHFVVVDGGRKALYLLEGGIVVWEVGFFGRFHPILSTEGSFHEVVEELPFWVLRAEMNVLKMPHPLQIGGVTMGVVSEDFLFAEFAEGVGIINASFDGESYGFWGVSLG